MPALLAAALSLSQSRLFAFFPQFSRKRAPARSLFCLYAHVLSYSVGTNVGFVWIGSVCVKGWCHRNGGIVTCIYSDILLWGKCDKLKECMHGSAGEGLLCCIVALLNFVSATFHSVITSDTLACDCALKRLIQWKESISVLRNIVLEGVCFSTEYPQGRSIDDLPSADVPCGKWVKNYFCRVGVMYFFRY